MQLRHVTFGLVTALGAAHLTLVGFSAFARSPRPHGVVGEALQLYGAVTGANNSYSFFAPGVPSQLRARFFVTLPDGSETEMRLAPGATAEADRRINNTLGTSLLLAKDPQLRRAILASWAAKVFASYPGASAVRLSLETFDLPTMVEWHAGRRADWQSYFSERFERGSF